MLIQHYNLRKHNIFDEKFHDEQMRQYGEVEVVWEHLRSIGMVWGHPQLNTNGGILVFSHVSDNVKSIYNVCIFAVEVVFKH